MKYAIALAAVLLAPIAQAAPGTIAGTASVIDGDTIEIHGKFPRALANFGIAIPRRCLPPLTGRP